MFAANRIVRNYRGTV